MTSRGRDVQRERGKTPGNRENGRRALAIAAAYATHTLLDWLGTDSAAPFGIMALWPVTDDYYEVVARVPGHLATILAAGFLEPQCARGRCASWRSSDRLRRSLPGVVRGSRLPLEQRAHRVLVDRARQRFVGGDEPLLDQVVQCVVQRDHALRAVPTASSTGSGRSSPSRIRLLIAVGQISTSSAATRPPPILRHSVCAITPRSDSDSMTRICACRPAGNCR